jgi:alkanesulfonate monooxygenase SsuD/methylene tetrahydromethanopterin reductase-like flavin-dependent oxidoreductase (luciferase family)
MTTPAAPPEALAGIGVMVPNIDAFRAAPPVLDLAVQAEQAGFDAVWLGDHLQFHSPVLEPACTMAAIAARTSRVRLGFGVMLMALRSPAWIAKQVATIDALAPGRVILGAGVGGENPAEFLAAGVDPRERGRRVDRAIEVVRRLLAGEAVDEPDHPLPVVCRPLEPVPSRVPPLVVGGRSDRALERVAREADGWLAVWRSPEEIRQAGERIAAAAVAHGRPAPATNVLVFAHVDDDRSRARAEAEAFMGGQYAMPLERVERHTAMGSRAEVEEHLRALLDAGVQGLVLVPAARDAAAQIERLADLRASISAGLAPSGDLARTA